MTQAQHPAVNPFALLMDPEAVFKAIANSERLERLHSRICRPLDRPLLPLAAGEGDEGPSLREGYESEDEQHS
jgi:hypothetical protein